MSNPKTYILQKDIPGVKAGAKYEKTNDYGFYYHKSGNCPSFHISIVENNPEWFLPEEPPIYTKTQLIKYMEDAYRQGKIDLEGGKYWEGSFPTYFNTLNL